MLLITIALAGQTTRTTIRDLQQVLSNGGTSSDCYPSEASSDVVHTVEATVSAINQPAGFYIQEAAAVWSGIFVYAPQDATKAEHFAWPAGLAVGDRVEVDAKVTEYFGMTELLHVQRLAVTAHNQALSAVSASTGVIGTSCSAGAEPYEGMLVTLTNVRITEAADRWGRVGIDDGSGLTRLDDDIFDSNSLLATHYGADAIMGATLLSVTGVVRFSWGSYAIFPRSAADMQFGDAGHAPADGHLLSPPPPAASCIQHGKDFRGPEDCGFPPMVAIADDDLSGDEGMVWFDGMHVYEPLLDSPEACQALCAEFVRCEYFSYEREYGKHLCYLKAAYADADAACNVFSDWNGASCGGGTGECAAGPARCDGSPPGHGGGGGISGFGVFMLILTFGLLCFLPCGYYYGRPEKKKEHLAMIKDKVSSLRGRGRARTGVGATSTMSDGLANNDACASSYVAATLPPLQTPGAVSAGGGSHA